MQSAFEFYDQWNGLLIALCGVYATLLAYGYLPRTPKDPVKLALWRKKFGPMMRILGPAILIMGLGSFVNALMKDPIEAEVRKANESAPRMIDPVTRFDRAIAGPGQRITFEHTLLTIRSSQVTPDSWQRAAPELRRNILKGSGMNRLHQKGVKLLFRYHDVNGVVIGELKISPTDPAP